MGGEALLTIGEIYKENSKIVYGFLLSYTKDASLSEELTQETFLRAIKSIHKYNGKCKISVWLCQIAKHILFQEWEKRGKTINVSYDENIQIKGDSTEELVISNENKKSIYKIIQSLENPYKEVIYLRLTGDLSFKEISEILGKSENWARVTFYRGKSKLIRRLEDGE
ncbi:ECF RNA polymerase sigma factor SigM [bioreactor metagenome]|jgi:RNA polymerase sigma factor (sigma-70 family)|uniref:ECF RNA polymerase sigma factor SigM n=1 Tax=bioreactor metagenome TaxID=1076179 RepID=A0A644YQ82_9ZZZZ|nr:RNA polymerase subunit sigma [Clostridium sp. C8]